MFAALEACPQSGDSVVPPQELRERLNGEIRRLETALESGTPLEEEPLIRGRVLPVGPVEIHRELRFLRQVAIALEAEEPGPVWYDRAGLGSVLLVQDMQSGYERVYRLMAGPLYPLDASQVALDSSIGEAFRGERRGNAVCTDGPYRRRHLRIVTLKTLPQRLGMVEPSLPTSGVELARSAAWTHGDQRGCIRQPT